MVAQQKISTVVFDEELSPAQGRNIEKIVNTKVVDRTQVILDIFAQHARTAEGRLQIELAQLEYLLPRLRRMWTHLERQKGGIGMHGPGEKQLELDRRRIVEDITRHRRRLGQVQSRRSEQRRGRRRHGWALISLVGYTNAGKSTLFNLLTAGGAFAHDKLFATLSTRVERWDLGGGNACMLSDTVGFVRDLPHHLVASFRSTLEETIDARLLLVVVDGSDPAGEMQIRTVTDTLDGIGAGHQPRIIVVNKVDRLEAMDARLAWLNRHPDAVLLSAVTGEGMEELVTRVREHVLGPIREVWVEARTADTRTVSFLEQRTPVRERDWEDGTVRIRTRLGRRQLEQLLALGGGITVDGRPGVAALAELWPDGSPQGPPPRRVPLHERFHG